MGTCGHSGVRELAGTSTPSSHGHRLGLLMFPRGSVCQMQQEKGEGERHRPGFTFQKATGNFKNRRCVKKSKITTINKNKHGQCAGWQSRVSVVRGPRGHGGTLRWGN